MRYHFTPVRMAIIKKYTNSKCCRSWGEKGTLLHYWWKYKLIQPLQRTVWRFLKKHGIKISCEPTVPLLGIHPEESTTEKDTCTQMFIAALFTIARTWKHLDVHGLMSGQRLWYIYTMDYYSAIKRNTFELAVVKQMNQEPIKQSEANQKEKNKYRYQCYIWNLEGWY